MNYNEVIDTLTREIDNDTSRLLPVSGKLLLFGSQESVFLKSIKKKADILGIQYEHTLNFTPPYAGAVVDTETCSLGIRISPNADIDHSFSEGMSSVSKAIFLLLSTDMVCGKDITIIGRGHSVKGLAQVLIDNHATVTVAHSKTKSLLNATLNRDVVIYATPTITQDISYNTRNLAIDLGNSVPHPNRFCCPYVNRIGKLTVSILLNEFVRKAYGE
jgi:hypothetical protein